MEDDSTVERAGAKTVVVFSVNDSIQIKPSALELMIKVSKISNQKRFKYSNNMHQTIYIMQAAWDLSRDTRNQLYVKV